VELVAGPVSVQRFIRHRPRDGNNDGRDNRGALDTAVPYDDCASDDRTRNDDRSAAPADDDGGATAAAADRGNGHGALAASTAPSSSQLTSWWAEVQSWSAVPWWSAGVQL
jgi:hypothetical protein